MHTWATCLSDGFSGGDAGHQLGPPEPQQQRLGGFRDGAARPWWSPRAVPSPGPAGRRGDRGPDPSCRHRVDPPRAVLQEPTDPRSPGRSRGCTASAPGLTGGDQNLEGDAHGALWAQAWPLPGSAGLPGCYVTSRGGRAGRTAFRGGGPGGLFQRRGGMALGHPSAATKQAACGWGRRVRETSELARGANAESVDPLQGTEQAQDPRGWPAGPCGGGGGAVGSCARRCSPIEPGGSEGKEPRWASPPGGPWVTGSRSVSPWGGGGRAPSALGGFAVQGGGRGARAHSTGAVPESGEEGLGAGPGHTLAWSPSPGEASGPLRVAPEGEPGSRREARGRRGAAPRSEGPVHLPADSLGAPGADVPTHLAQPSSARGSSGWWWDRGLGCPDSTARARAGATFPPRRPGLA